MWQQQSNQCPLNIQKRKSHSKQDLTGAFVNSGFILWFRMKLQAIVCEGTNLIAPVK